MTWTVGAPEPEAFLVSTRDSLRPIDGWRVIFDGFEALDLRIHPNHFPNPRDPDDVWAAWAVSDVASGRRVAAGRTWSDALRAADEKLRGVGLDGTLHAIRSWTAETPR